MTRFSRVRIPTEASINSYNLEANAPRGGSFVIPRPYFGSWRPFEAEKSYRDLQKPCQPRSAVFTVDNLRYITNNAQL